MANTKLNVINPGDRSWTSGSFILCFGAYGNLHMLVYADHLQDALDECIDWAVENAKGLIVDTDELLTAQLEELGRSEEDWTESLENEEAWALQAWDDATADLTCGGNAGDYITWEWGIVAENPTKQALIERYGR